MGMHIDLPGDRAGSHDAALLRPPVELQMLDELAMSFVKAALTPCRQDGFEKQRLELSQAHDGAHGSSRHLRKVLIMRVILPAASSPEAC
ncbi:hypothetical protein D3C72_1866410 [compost metagenome]